MFSGKLNLNCHSVAVTEELKRDSTKVSCVKPRDIARWHSQPLKRNSQKSFTSFSTNGRVLKCGTKRTANNFMDISSRKRLKIERQG